MLEIPGMYDTDKIEERSLFPIERDDHAKLAQQSPQALESLKVNKLTLFWEQLNQMGAADAVLRLGTHLLSIGAIILVAWGMRQFYLNARLSAASMARQQAMIAAIATPTPNPAVPALSPLENYTKPLGAGIHRLPVIFTTIPNRLRMEVITYTVQPEDTVFGIAEKFGLRPNTILWGNYETLRDDPHRLKPGQVLNILPADGTYYEWHTGDGLNGVAKFFGVTPETIIDWPSNHLSPDTIGDYANPNITPSTWIFIPGGYREFVTWSAPRITREDPSVAKVLGPGHCGPVDHGPLGKGSFIWPANNHFLSGYNYLPETNHYGIDIDGNSGDSVYAVDDGVVVYSGWNNWGYGYVIVIDHGNGWQSLYGHLSAISVGCGQFAYQGNVIGAIGATGNASGPHLHFELMSDTYGKVNPWNFLP
jgi:murein DD-endopeptidase MepM/ murein hydrolase activator NlpD